MAINPTDGPIHDHFGLSYCNYAVLPRTLMQSMSPAWQERMTACLDELAQAFAHIEQAEIYDVKAATEHIVSELTDQQLRQARITAYLCRLKSSARCDALLRSCSVGSARYETWTRIMPVNTPVTSAVHRRVEWKVLDRALAPYATGSLIVLLQAALTSPDCQRLEDHLLLMLTRVLRTPSRSGAAAGADDLPKLVDAIVRAAPGRPVLTGRDPSDLRAVVGSTVTGERLLVHPGQLARPLLVLRSLQLTALAVDQPLCEAVGFGIGDVVDLALRITDRALNALAPAWPEPYIHPDGTQEDLVACRLTPAEADAATAIATADPAGLVAACRHPERAARALTWLTSGVKDLPLRYHPDRPLLGPVLAVTAHGRRLPVPAGAATDAIAPAAAHELITQVRIGRAAGPGTDLDTFTDAWNSAHPLLLLTGITTFWPPTSPVYTLPRTPHLHARALRAAAAAVRRARVPAGTWHKADACRPGGPAEQLLHTLEAELADQISAYQPVLFGESPARPPATGGPGQSRGAVAGSDRRPAGPDPRPGPHPHPPRSGVPHDLPHPPLQHRHRQRADRRRAARPCRGRPRRPDRHSTGPRPPRRLRWPPRPDT
ncbi:hypothetical protein [Streptomyces galilaeus]|uniref:hypothetical protein n=1 Tax=Streptomyces galilaeus TaxID=33899 RepID=UPI0038F7CDEC